MRGGRLAMACALFGALTLSAAGAARAASLDEGFKAFTNGDYAAAEAAFLAVLADSPRNLEAMRLLGTSLLAEGRLREAYSTYQTLRVLAPDDSRVLFGLARVYYQAGLRTLEREALVTALRLDPEFTQAHYFLAHNLLGGGELYAASAEYVWLFERQERAGEPADPTVLFNLGILDMRLGRPERGLGLLSRFLAAVPEGAQADQARSLVGRDTPATP